MNNDEEAYIYAFADNISTHVSKNSTIAFPSDTKVVQLDDQKGSDFLLILYVSATDYRDQTSNNCWLNNTNKILYLTL